MVCTKAGFLTAGAVPDSLRREDVVGGMHSMAPDFLEDQIERSRVNLDVDTIDVFYLHNPETQLGFCTRDEFEERVRRAFERLERLVARGRIWRVRHGDLGRASAKRARSICPRLAGIAMAEGGPDHHFRFIQLPFNLGMVEAYVGPSGECPGGG